MKQEKKLCEGLTLTVATNDDTWLEFKTASNDYWAINVTQSERPALITWANERLQTGL